ncbi:MAG: hypothetical protein A2860_02535 [Candidatus Levybacteria bacterium RIFCSPHIGHO2_01_FULL_37_33]|nr:MAG: hypothetical protein A2860_02535 [Candidatus Levybacteria bacterium RIFCSPHIGHO2_01_FULL_37_33]OGH16836.1 MAG: hypothetical protein A3C97_02630 [Candidatus Levybacteria bacterium RIFCSPHIGHO2_02_FULL_37_11]OGH33234.1 MAG: hypothetical protein A2953_00805 [Candidatus Levybacteria bacterium RIFCSPLOWO2_01_FULL_36_54]
MKKFLLFLFLLFVIFPTSVFATLGVGVGTGKIQIDEKLKPGIIYQFPPFTIINTGDEPSDYEADISYHEKQPQLRPPKSWFIFSPQKFHLDPGKVQIVNVKLNLPVITQPGDYFAYLEGHPIKKSQKGQTSIGIAAAAKLYFTVVPANIFTGIYYKIISFWKVYAPWPQRFIVLLAIGIAYIFIRKRFNIQIGLKKQQTEASKQGTPRRSRRRRLEEFNKQDKKNE